MPHLTAACFGKSEQKSVHPFVSFGKVGASRGTFISIVREKKSQLLLIPASWKGVCLCIWKFQLPFMLEIGICVLMLIFSMALCKHGEHIQPRFKTPWDYLTLKWYRDRWYPFSVDTVGFAEKTFTLLSVTWTLEWAVRRPSRRCFSILRNALRVHVFLPDGGSWMWLCV